jgi:hypothetical protein
LGKKGEGLLLLCKLLKKRHRSTQRQKTTPATEVAASAEATNLESTLSDIDRVLLDLAVERLPQLQRESRLQKKLLQSQKKPWP